MTSMQEFNCILCKETFSNKEDLQIHFRKHGDPEFNKNVKKSRSQSEQEEIEIVNCDVCSEVFPSISKAITHKHKMHPDHDAKYFCPWCGKLFTMKHLYNKHLQSIHVDSEQRDDSNFHCDACDVDFFAPTAMLYHNKFFHRQDLDLPSVGQSKKLRMCPQNTVIQIYYCSFCGDEYDNKVNLHKHIGDDHSDENQSPEDVLRCPLCDAIFYHLDAYELHLTFHSTEDLYSNKNEMFEQMIEFSLETVAPIMEKIENVEPRDAETEMNAVGLDKFLELAMGNSLDKSEEKHRTKSKKHKKHKKSKSAITLDEFLNMNKDVFGEGLDFEGIEEVPTQVVAKRLKQKKPTKASMKSLESSNLEKLKKQGIVVKVQSAKNPRMPKVNLGKRKMPASESKPSKQLQSSSEEVLSKLINQSNNQIQIVKKSSSQESVDESVQQDKSDKPVVDNIDKTRSSPENIEVECDVNMPSEYTSSENETKEDVSKKKNNSTNQNDRQIISNRSNYFDDIPKDDSCREREESDAVNEGDITSERHCFDEEKIDNFNQVKSITNPNFTTLQKTNKLPEKPISLTDSNSAEHHQIAVMGDSKNNCKNKTENDLERYPKSPPDQSTNYQSNSLNALKHLSHLITVKSVTSKTSSAPVSPVQKCVEQKVPRVVEEPDDSNFDEEDNIQTQNNKKEIAEKNEASLNKLEHIKKICNNITIKPLTHSPKNVTESCDDDKEIKPDKPIPNVPTTNKVASPAKIPDTKPLKSSKITNNIQSVKSSEKEITTPSNIDLLKHLTNVTAKPVSTVKGKIQQISSTTISNMPSTFKKNVIQNYPKKEEIKEDEIFNIDDSDDEPDKIHRPLVAASTPSPKANLSENLHAKSVEKPLNIGKHVTMKSINQQALPLRKNNIQQPKFDERFSKVQHSMTGFSDDDDDDDQNTLIPTNFNILKQKQTLQNDHIKNTLKSLGKHITVKSGIPSPNTSIKSDREQDSKDMFGQAGDSDSDSYKGGVKITEVTEDDVMSEDDMAEQEGMNFTENVSVKSPRETYSDDNDNHFDEVDDEQFDDVEHQIKANTVKKPTPNITAQMLNLQNMNKNITIKSLSDKTKSNTEQSIKPSNLQFKPEGRDGIETVVNKKVKNAAQVARSMSQNTASCSQQNTVNKEVTVKTIQTKTVIQEITTTVTKTIKTVNQTVKQELQSIQGTSHNNQMMFQKVQGMKSMNQVKNFQGVTVRQAAPVAGTKIKGATVLNRPSVGATIRPSNQLVSVRPSNQVVPVRPSNQVVPVRPSNQIVPMRPSNTLVPVRPAMNTAKMSRPRMTGPKKATPSTSANQQKPIKMSPHAVNTSRRPSEEPAGHFSCFKKPKESLIPVSDIPSFNSDQSGEAVVQYSSSHTSRSNFTSATKTVKGGKVVTSSQMKTEMSASSQQLKRLNSMSGLKVVKTSQMKQATQVEEKCESSEINASKRNALEAIEKLQKQGLLIKKPRLDASNDSDHSDEGNSYITEEPDDD